MPKGAKAVRRVRQPEMRKKRRIMASNNDPQGAAAQMEEGREGANVEKIRDILFGAQMRDYDKRFARLEDRLMKDAEALREEMRKRLDALESFVKQEAEALGQRIKSEKGERSEAIKDLGRELRDSGKAIEKKIAQLDDDFNAGQGELRAKILEQFKSLSTEIKESHRALSTALNQEAQSLRSDLTDRVALADLFSEVSMRLKKEFELPEK
jgi:gas vesicle protein